MKVIVNNAALARALKVAQGATVTVACKNGVPVTREWRNRIRDAKIDGCLSFPQTKAAKLTKKGTE